jgi:AraC-like DNA-binding protein
MLYLRHIPKPPLSSFVELFWYWDGFPPRRHTHERLMPDGSVAMVINLRDDSARIYDRDNLRRYTSFPGALVCGPHSSFFVIDTAEQASVIGIQFRPGGAFPFFKLPVDELHNLHVSLVDLWGAEASLLRERVLEAPTPEQKFLVLESCLLDKAFKPLERHRAVEGALALFRNIHTAPLMAKVSDQIGISSRRLIQLFSGHVGLTPKLFCRVRRFQRVLQLVHEGTGFDWVELAADCGYFDQAHFIHDFTAFSGMTPGTYLSLRTEHLNHVPIPG